MQLDVRSPDRSIQILIEAPRPLKAGAAKNDEQMGEVVETLLGFGRAL